MVFEVRFPGYRTLVHWGGQVSADDIASFIQKRKPDSRGKFGDEAATQIYVPERQAGMPLEFAGAAYRFGHARERGRSWPRHGGVAPIHLPG